MPRGNAAGKACDEVGRNPLGLGFGPSGLREMGSGIDEGGASRWWYEDVDSERYGGVLAVRGHE